MESQPIEPDRVTLPGSNRAPRFNAHGVFPPPSQVTIKNRPAPVTGPSGWSDGGRDRRARRHRLQVSMRTVQQTGGFVWRDIAPPL